MISTIGKSNSCLLVAERVFLNRDISMHDTLNKKELFCKPGIINLAKNIVLLCRFCDVIRGESIRKSFCFEK